jgi:hypothetical protein
MFTTLQKMQHFIGTAVGVSSTSFKGMDVPFQGLGQGNGAGPTGWAVVSAPIINMVRAAGYGAAFVSAISCAIVSFVCYAFVDDMDLNDLRRLQLESRGSALASRLCSLEVPCPSWTPLFFGCVVCPQSHHYENGGIPDDGDAPVESTVRKDYAPVP